MLDWLLEKRKIRIQRGPILDEILNPMPPEFDFGKVEGMMLGLAIGDALGNTTEGMLPDKRRAYHGEITDYLPNRHAENQPRGVPSDDTQLAFWTLEMLIQDKGFVPEHVADRFCRDRIYGIGGTVSDFLKNYKSGKAWYESGPASAGNGALMRIAPILIPHLKAGCTSLWEDTALCSMITHNDPASISSCVAFAGILWDLLKKDSVPAPGWWVERYCAIAGQLETGATYRPRGRCSVIFEGPLWQFVQENVSDAFRRGISVLEACNHWRSGAYLLETVPSALFILMKHGGNPEEAIIRAVNDTKDNDTIAAIVGAAVGALHGKDSLPDRWIEGLTGRTKTKDDGRVFSLIEEARICFWSEEDKK